MRQIFRSIGIIIAFSFLAFPQIPVRTPPPPPTLGVDFQTCGGVVVVQDTDQAGVLTITDAIGAWTDEGCADIVFKPIDGMPGTYLGYGVRIALAQ